MKELKLYQCEICNTQYKSKIDAMECERSHVKPICFDDFKFLSCSQSQDGLPEWIEMVFPNGERKRYYK